MNRTRPAGRPPGARIDAVYAALPRINCQRKCQACCGSIGMTALEQQRIKARHGITLPLLAAFHTPANPDGRCPALTTAGACSAYDTRPFICRLWGLTEKLRCPHGCIPEGGFLPEAEALRLLAQIRRH